MIFRGQVDPKTGAIEGNWNAPENWSGGTAPTAADEAVFDADSPSCRLSADAACLRLRLDGFRGVIDTGDYGLTLQEHLTGVLAAVAGVDAARKARLADKRVALAEATMAGEE